MRSGGCAGSSRALRLDPFGLPVRFLAGDAIADGQVREVELHRERVVLRRALRGMRMALNMPVAAFDGVSLWLVPGEEGGEDTLAVVLKHRDPDADAAAICNVAPDEALAEWRAWSQVLGVPLLLAEQRGSVPAARAQLDQLADRASASAPPPSERTESASAFNSSPTRKRQDDSRDAGPSWRTRDHRAKLVSPLASVTALFAPLEFHRAGLHDQLDMTGIDFSQHVRRVPGTDLSGGEFVDDAIVRRPSDTTD